MNIKNVEERQFHFDKDMVHKGAACPAVVHKGRKGCAVCSAALRRSVVRFVWRWVAFENLTNIRINPRFVVPIFLCAHSKKQTLINFVITLCDSLLL